MNSFVIHTLWLWVCNSSRRHLIVMSLEKPMTTQQLLKKCQEENPLVRAEDNLKQLKGMIEKGIIRVINTRLRRGRLYYFTPDGLLMLKTHAGIAREKLDQSIDWDVFGKVLHSKLRKSLLVEIENPIPDWDTNTPTGLKRRLLPTHPSCISNVTSTLHELVEEGLLEVKARKTGSHQRLYKLSDKGKGLLELLRG